MIKVNNISKKYGEIKALSNISLEVQKGELMGLIGPDGAGKSTLFRILTSLLLPDSGDAYLNGYHTKKDYKKIRKEIGYMPGRFSLYQDLTVEENLTFFATTFGTTIDENYDLIKDIYIQIEPFKKRQAGKLSGGMKQKLALSCALIHKPVILILDEPTTGVDAVSRKEFWEMLQGLKRNGITIIVSTPYMDEAILCDRIALIQEGELMCIDTPQQIISDFDFNLYAIKSDNNYHLINYLKAFKFTHAIYPFGDSLHFVSKEITNEQIIIESYLQKFATQSTIEKVEPTIEDCFIELMTRKKTS